jgi:hypothetical protein
MFKDKRRGTVSIGQLPDCSMDTLMRLSDEELPTFIAGWQAGTENHIRGMRELDRRTRQPAETRAWIAIVVSVASLAVAVTAAILK